MIPSGNFQLRNRRSYHWWFIGPLAVLVFVAWLLVPSEQFFEATISILIALGGVTGFLYSQHLEETRLFKDLFREFNERYDKLNEALSAISNRRDNGKLSDGERNKLIDYFNLCAEEYLFFQAGYIDAEVWRSWLRGMSEYANDPEIRGIWEDEIHSGSYYGFSLDLIPKLALLPPKVAK